MSIQRIAIIGAGQMGSGIAHVFALAGCDVLLNDLSVDRIETGIASITGNLNRQAAKSKITEAERDKALGQIHIAASLNNISDVDMVIEAATENEELKVSILKEVCAVIGPDTIIASNTSSISITRLASATDRPEKFIGMHFMNPVPVMQLVEIIRGIATSDETYQSSNELVQRIGKTSALSEDFPAFIVNRVLLPMINEAVFALYEGVGTVDSIDKAMKLGANHPMGPLQLADFIGLDTCLSIMFCNYECIHDRTPASFFSLSTNS